MPAIVYSLSSTTKDRTDLPNIAGISGWESSLVSSLFSAGALNIDLIAGDNKAITKTRRILVPGAHPNSSSSA